MSECEIRASSLEIDVNPPGQGETAEKVIAAAFKEMRDSSLDGKPTRASLRFSTGIYPLQETLVINREQLGNFSGELVLEGPWDADAVFVGSFEVIEWHRAKVDGLPHQAEGKIWVAKIDEKQASPKTLFDKEGLLERARSGGFVPDASGTLAECTFPANLLRNNISTSELELIVRPYYLWCANILPIGNVDFTTHRATTALPATYAMQPVSAWGDDLTESAWFENDVSFIQKPGDWVASGGKIYLWPRNGKAPEGIRSGSLTELFRIEGDESSRKPLANITLRRLVFSQAERDSLQAGDIGLQHDWDFYDKGNAMLRLRWVRDVVVEDCRFEKSGASGMRADLYAQNVTVQQNVFNQLGGGGILFCGYGPGTVDVNKDNTITENRIEDCGRLYWHSSAIQLWQSGNNRVSRNLLRDLPYTGIIVSGTGVQHFANRENPVRELDNTIRWNEIGPGPYTIASIQPFMHSRNNVVEGNEITRIMRVLGDGNGIYVRYSSETGNVIRGNYIHEILQKHSAGGIRCDDLQNGVLIENNFLYRIQHAGYSSNGRNSIVNNYLVDILNEGNADGLVTPFFRGYITLWNDFVHGSEFRQNVFCDTGNGKPEFFFLTFAPWSGDKVAELKDTGLSSNLYWVNGNSSWAQTYVAKQLEEGAGSGSVAADPEMERLPSGRMFFNSKALSNLGIKPFDWEMVGLSSANKIFNR